jgi:hypothetical protein
MRTTTCTIDYALPNGDVIGVDWETSPAMARDPWWDRYAATRARERIRDMAAAVAAGRAG